MELIRSRKERGQGLVELALVLPILLFVIFGLIESARMMQAFLSVQSAAREGARYAVTGRPTPEECDDLLYPPDQYIECRVDSIKATARAYAVGLPVDPTETDPGRPGYLGIQVRGKPCWGCEAQLDRPGIPGTRVEVTVSFNLPIVVPLFSSYLPALRLNGQTQMVNEGFQMGFGSEPPPTMEPAPTEEPLDSDGDGVCDSEERDIYGTSPSLPDTDGDELSDGDEIGDLLCDGAAVTPTSDPLDRCDPWPGADHDGDGMSDCEEEAWGDCLDPYNGDSDGDGWSDGYEIDPQCEIDQGEVCHPCDPNLPGVPGPPPTSTPTPTNTPTPTPTATPTPLPVVIFEPLLEGYTYVAGSGQPGEAVRIRDVTEAGSPLIGQGVIQGDSSWRVDVSPPLIGGHLIYALTNTSSDSATVVASTPTPFIAPSMDIVAPTPACGPEGADVNFTVSGSNWPTETVAFSWDGTDSVARAKTGYAFATPNASGNFTSSFTVDATYVTSGTHTLYARMISDPYYQDSEPYYVPCEGAPTPTPTPTPILPADLIVQSLQVSPSGTITSTDPITITTVIKNNSTGPANELFWVDMYVNPAPEPPGLRQAGTDWSAVAGLDANTAITITFHYSFVTTGTHKIYAQADTFDYITESDEGNNVSGPETVDYQGSVPSPTPMPTPSQYVGSISGATWIWLGGQWSVPTERVDLYLYSGSDLIATTTSEADGTYQFDMVPAGTNYTVIGETVVDNTPYSDTRTGIEVIDQEETANVDLYLTALY